jgi:hypothetical protein
MKRFYDKKKMERIKLLLKPLMQNHISPERNGKFILIKGYKK